VSYATAVNPRHVAAVKLGVGRGARHQVVLASGKEVQVSFSYAAKIFDRLHGKLDRITPAPWKTAQSKPKRRARV
jgi:hypothetical protein